MILAERTPMIKTVKGGATYDLQWSHKPLFNKSPIITSSRRPGIHPIPHPRSNTRNTKANDVGATVLIAVNPNRSDRPTHIFRPVYAAETAHSKLVWANRKVNTIPQAIIGIRRSIPPEVGLSGIGMRPFHSPTRYHAVRAVINHGTAPTVHRRRRCRLMSMHDSIMMEKKERGGILEAAFPPEFL
jgi:hypothetical protein